jgi:hypothetical protein
MLLGNFQSLDVYQVDNSNFRQIGIIDQLISVDWKKYFTKYGDATIKVIPTKQNIELLKKGNILSPGSKNAIKIDTVEIVEDKGKYSLQVKGLTLEKILSTRVSSDFAAADSGIDAPEMVSTLVNSNLGPVAGIKRGIRYFEVSEDIPIIGPLYKRQNKGNLYDIVEEYCNLTPTMGYEIQFVPGEQKLLFQILQGTDHSASSNSPVIFSNSLDNLFSFDYYTSDRDYKNYAYVYGELKDSGRTKVEVGDYTLSGYERYEHFVDARDLQSETDDGHVIPDEEYEAMLYKRGQKKLSELQVVETISGKLNVDNSTFVYGVDYGIGDKVTIVDEAIGIQVDAIVIGVQEKYSTTYSSELIVGYEMPTVSEKIKTIYG